VRVRVESESQSDTRVRDSRDRVTELNVHTCQNTVLYLTIFSTFSIFFNVRQKFVNTFDYTS
jgi:hypothetical protein